MLDWGRVAGVHHQNTSAAVGRPQGADMALAAKKVLDIWQYDMPTALTNAAVDETIFVNDAWLRGASGKNEVHHVKRYRMSLDDII